MLIVRLKDEGRKFGLQANTLKRNDRWKNMKVRKTFVLVITEPFSELNHELNFLRACLDDDCYGCSGSCIRHCVHRYT